MVLCKMEVMSMMLLILITSVVLQGPRAVESKGERCMFREGLLPVDAEHRNTFHTIQSAAPQGFYLGFNLRPRSTFALGEGRTGRGAMARVGWRRPGESCGFRFTSERRRRRRKQKQDVLLDSILQYIEDNEVGRKEGEVGRIEETLEEEKEEERVSDLNSVDTRRRGRKERRRGSKRPKVRHLAKKQLRPNRREKNRRRGERKSKRKPSMRSSRPRQ